MSLKNQQIEMVVQVISRIPSGSVATYGQVAEMANLNGRARWVGRILSQLPVGTRLPWHRVISSSGRITNPNIEEQRDLLRQEGVTVREDRVLLKRFRWHPAHLPDGLPRSSEG